MAASIRVLVVVARGWWTWSKRRKLITDLKACGLKIDEVQEIGCITGEIDPAKRSTIEALPGVHSVEGPGEVTLA